MTMRALFAGVTGLRNHQIRMDVIGNNVANVNTIGFKASRVTFKEAFAQLLQGASRPAGSAGDASFGTNPIQVGLGMNIGSIDMLYNQGSLQNTGVTTDLAIQGEAMFVTSNGTGRFYTRSGNFQLDAQGRLVASTNGFVVQGRMAVDGVISEEIQDINLPLGQKAAAKATTTVSVGGNLDAGAPVGTTRQTTMTVFDSVGRRHEVTLTFTKAAALGDWTYDVSVKKDGVAETIVSQGAQAVTFLPNGRLDTPENFDMVFTPDGLPDQTLSFDLGTQGTTSGMSQFANPSNAVLREQDGFTNGELQRISIDATGTITGGFTNGVNQILAQIVLADFNNPRGLIRTGDNSFTVSANSGPAILGNAGQGSQSSITSGALEMSNVDLAEQFTDMIIAQRGFQSNARVITTTDEMLQELVNLKR